MKRELRPSVQYVNLEDKTVVHHDDEYVSFTGDSLSLVQSLLPLLEEGCTSAAAADQCSIEEDTVESVFKLFSTHNLLRSTHEIKCPENLDQVHLESRTDPGFAVEAMQSLSESEVTIATPDDVSPPPSIEFSEEVTHQNVDPSAVSDLLVSITYHHSPQTQRAYNDAAMEHGFEFLPIRVFSNRFIVGPYLVPEKTACFDCAYRRELTACDAPSTVHSFEDTMDDGDSYQSITIPLTQERRALLDGVVGTEVKKIITKYDTPNTFNAVCTVDFDTLTVESDHILKVPGCTHG